jgi:hypothetical protein
MAMPGRLMPFFSPSMPPLMIYRQRRALQLHHAQLDEAVGEQDARALFSFLQVS